jgi:formamidase
LPAVKPSPIQPNIKTVCKVNTKLPADQQPTPVHNRWHPDVPTVAHVKPGEVFKVECIDWTGGQILNDDSADDVRDVDLSRVHYLSGPVAVEGAHPGDLLVVQIVDIGALPGEEWGFTGIFAKENGGGFLDGHYPKACKAIWDFEGIYASSRHIPHVRFAGLIHPGLMGCAPSQELLNTWNARERELVATAPDRVPPLACPPLATGALAGDPHAMDPALAARIREEGARTVPPREHGGNCDIKNLSKGSTIYFPVYVEGAKLSMGDIHFSQGDGEISFCGAIEMAGVLTLKTSIIPNGMALYNVKVCVRGVCAGVHAVLLTFLIPRPRPRPFPRRTPFTCRGPSNHGTTIN